MATPRVRTGTHLSTSGIPAPCYAQTPEACNAQRAFGGPTVHMEPGETEGEFVARATKILWGRKATEVPQARRRQAAPEVSPQAPSAPQQPLQATAEDNQREHAARLRDQRHPDYSEGEDSWAEGPYEGPVGEW